MLEVKNLSVSYGQHRALKMARRLKGEVVVILGANGAANSLLRAIAGLEGHCDGCCLRAFAHWRSPDEIVTGGIALVPEAHIFGDLNVEENPRPVPRRNGADERTGQSGPGS